MIIVYDRNIIVIIMHFGMPTHENLFKILLVDTLLLRYNKGVDGRVYCAEVTQS